MTSRLIDVPEYPLSTNLYDCTELSETKGRGALQLLDLCQDRDTEFLNSTRTREHRAVKSQVDGDGDISPSIPMAHGLLARCLDTPNQQSMGTGRLGYYQSQRYVVIRQFSFDTLRGVNKVVNGQLGLFQRLYPFLHCKYGFIDEDGENSPGIRSIRKQELKYLFWANLFGPPWVDKFGRDFLLNAPGWKTEQLDDGGILYVVTERYTDWYNKRPKKVLDYFKKKAPEVKLYRSTGVG